MHYYQKESYKRTAILDKNFFLDKKLLSNSVIGFIDKIYILLNLEVSKMRQLILS